MDHPLIRKLEAVERLSESEKAMVIAVCHDVQVTPRKRDIISEGENPEFLHLIIEGWAARYKILDNGARMITAFMMPGDFCDLHVTVLSAMDHGIVALTDCKVAYIASEDVDRMTRNSATLARAFWRATLVDEAILRQWLTNSGRRDAFQAIAHLLCELHLRATLVGLAPGDRLMLPVTQEELGDATGLTPVHVNRTLQRLRGNGLVEIGKGELFVADVAGLRRACRFDVDYLHLKISDDYPVDRPQHSTSVVPVS